MRPSSISRRQWLVVILAGAAVLIVAAGLMSRRSRAEHLRAGAAERAVPTVALVAPTQLTAASLELAGRIEAWARAPIYARVSGYVKRWTVDIGGTVKSGQLLAEIETPDLDQQLLQARAELATARSDAALAASTARRWQSLLESDSVSRQESDEKAGDLAAKQSRVNALQANVDRVLALQQYKRLQAPFDGIVTARNTDVGSLINVGMAPGSELFVVSDIHRLRVYVNVPQRQVSAIHMGGAALLAVPEQQGKTYAATVQSFSQAIDTGSGTMLVQLAVDNPASELLPGGYATVRFSSPAAAGGLGLPPGALVIGKDGVRVATVDDKSTVQLKLVTIGRDFGNVIELAGGLAPADRVIANPPDGISTGDRVNVAVAQREAAR